MSPCFGRPPGDWMAHGSYRPSLVEFSRDVNKARNDNVNPSSRVPPPPPFGWDFDVYKGKLAIVHGPGEFRDYKSPLGFVYSITDADSTETGAPVNIPPTLKIPFKYGFSEKKLHEALRTPGLMRSRQKCVFGRLRSAFKASVSEFRSKLFAKFLKRSAKINNALSFAARAMLSWWDQLSDAYWDRRIVGSATRSFSRGNRPLSKSGITQIRTAISTMALPLIATPSTCILYWASRIWSGTGAKVHR